MEWETLFDDVQSRMDAAERDGVEEELGDLIEAEAATMTWLDRLRGAVGREVRVGVRGGTAAEGRVVDCGRDWVLLEASGREILVPLAALVWASPLTRSAPPPGLVASRLGLAHALRALARARVEVRVVVLGDQTLRGAIVRVGADHLDLGVAGGAVLSIGFAGIVTIVRV